MSDEGSRRGGGRYERDSGRKSYCEEGGVVEVDGPTLPEKMSQQRNTLVESENWGSVAGGGVEGQSEQ